MKSCDSNPEKNNLDILSDSILDIRSGRTSVLEFGSILDQEGEGFRICFPRIIAVYISVSWIMTSFWSRAYGKNESTVADVVLWRRRNVTMGILLGTLAAWLVFEVSGYTLLSLVSNVLLLLISILFVWAKAASVLNRPPPPIPGLQLSEQVVSEAVIFVHSHVNAVLYSFHDIALGKDSMLFYKVAACLWVISIISSWTDFLTLGYTSIVIVLIIPVLYEKYEDNIEWYIMWAYSEMWHHESIHAECYSKVKKWILEKKKKLS